MAWTLCLSGPAIELAGVQVNSDIVDYINNKANMDAASDRAEGYIELKTGKTFIASLSSMATGVQEAISNICQRLIAMDWIGVDITGFLTRGGDTLLNIHSNIIDKGLKDLEDFKKIKLKDPSG